MILYASIVRTLVPYIVGVLVAQAARVGMDLDPVAATSVVTVVVAGAYYSVARFLEKRWPVAGRVLLSLGLTTATNPQYKRGDAVRSVKLPRL